MTSQCQLEGSGTARTAAGDTFTAFVVEAAGLGHFVTAAGEALARDGGQTLARWVVLDAVSAQPATVAQIARRRSMARQPVQRVADSLVVDGLAAFSPNPRHRRAQLLTLTPEGRHVLSAISVRQRIWADAHGTRIGAEALERARALIAEIRPQITMPDSPSSGES